MTALDLSEWRWKNNKREYVATFLRRIGVTCKWGHGFWIRNADQLEYIFHDLCERGREIKIALHPQNGGCPQEFTDFNIQFEKAKRAFYRNGIRDPGGALKLLRTKQAEKITHLARVNFRNRQRK